MTGASVVAGREETGTEADPAAGRDGASDTGPAAPDEMTVVCGWALRVGGTGA
jgi:hypothetical protein